MLYSPFPETGEGVLPKTKHSGFIKFGNEFVNLLGSGCKMETGTRIRVGALHKAAPTTLSNLFLPRSGKMEKTSSPSAPGPSAVSGRPDNPRIFARFLTDTVRQRCPQVYSRLRSSAVPLPLAVGSSNGPMCACSRRNNVRRYTDAPKRDAD